MGLLRLAPITEGTILVNDLNLSHLKSDAVRSIFNVIPQQPILQSGSIRSNLDPSTACSDEMLQSVLIELGLWDVILAQHGLDADIEAAPMSQGQKQLFCIARSLCCNGNKRILLLDESTSSMDTETERTAMAFIAKHFRHHTVIAIAHRLETIQDFDRIAVMKGGKLVECDAPSVLLEKAEGAFRALWGERLK
jgi:ABC-type multidrug transport system fused ATPase/permease subunit